MRNQQPRLSESVIEHGKIYPVTVIALTETGAIVEVDDMKCTAFIHISKVAQGYVRDVNDFLTVGDKLNAMGDCKGRKNELVLTHLNLTYKKREDAPKEDIKDFKPKYEKKEYKPQPIPEQYTPSQHTTKSLDDMIAAADKSYKDKFNSRDKDRHKRKHYKNKNKLHRDF